MIQGDDYFSLPFTNPIALDLMPHGRDLGWDNEAMDSLEANPSLENQLLAMSSYAEGYSLFNCAGSRGGMGAILLRYAAIDQIQAVGVLTTNDGSHVHVLNSSLEHLRHAEQLFKGDHTHSLIVSGYVLIANIMSGEHHDVLHQAYDVGARSKQLDNLSVCQFIGMLLLRLARKLSSLEGGKSMSLLCCYCAEVICHVVDDRYLQLSAVVSLANFQRMNGNIPVALAHIENGRIVFAQFVAYVDRLSAHTIDDDARRILRSVRSNCTDVFNNIAAMMTNAARRGETIAKNESEAAQEGPDLEAQINNLISLLPTYEPLFREVITVERIVKPLRRIYNQAHADRRSKLRIGADVDAAENCLREALLHIETTELPMRSVEVDVYRIILSTHLGDFEKARQILPLTMPPWLGGRMQKSHEDSLYELIGTHAKQKQRDAGKYISLCFVCKHWELGGEILQRVQQSLPSFYDLIRNDSSEHSWMDMFWVGSLHEHTRNFEAALKWYTIAYEAVETKYRRLADINDRRNLFDSIHSGELFFGLARVAWHFSRSEDDRAKVSCEEWQLSAAQWQEQVLRFLDMGHSRALLDLLIVEGATSPEQLQLWSESSYQFTSQQLVPPTQANQPENPSSETSESKEEFLSRITTRLAAELNSFSLAKLVPETDLTSSLSQVIYSAIPADALVVHINIARDGTLILCISSKGIEQIHFDETIDLEIDKHILRCLKLFRINKGSRLPALSDCHGALSKISDIILKPIAQFLDGREHIIFIPSRSLNKFPFSALLLDDHPLFLTKDVSMCPSLATLGRLARKQTQKQANKEATLGIIYNDDSGPPLDLSALASIQIAQEHDTSPLPTSVLSHSDFETLYSSSSTLLLATHGNPGSSAWDSYLAMNPSFRVLDLSRLRTSAGLIVFEACISGLGEETVGNDVLGFSHIVLSSGAIVFLGALWYVSDEASSLLMLYFFRALQNAKNSVSSGSRPISVAHCWRLAQIELYSTSTSKAIRLFKRMVRQCRLAEKAGLVASAQAKNCYNAARNTIETMEMDGEEADYKHPFYWAPFVMVGFGGMSV
jgi:CHAT domain-containing protein